MKWLEDIENEKVCMSLYECGCGFHIGLDASYLDQVGDITTICPSCDDIIFIEGYEQPTGD